MDELQFDEDQVYVRVSPPPAPTGIIELVQRVGLAKNEQQANLVLIIIAIACVAGAIMLLFSGNNSAPRDLQFIEGQSVLQPPQGI